MTLLLLLACADDPKPAGDDTGAPPADCDDPLPAHTGPWFTEMTDTLGLPAGATHGMGRVTTVDLDGDLRDDLVAVPAHDGAHGLDDAYARRVWMAVGDGTFRDATATSGLVGTRLGVMVFGDVDNDGDQDAWGGTIQGVGVEDAGIYLNDGAGTFTFAGPNGVEPEQLDCGSYTCTEAQITGTFADLDRDGVLDLYTGGWFWSDGVTSSRYSPPPRDKVYRGLGDGTFDDRTRRLGDQTHPNSGASDSFGRAAMGVAPGDWDNDGDTDIFVGNYGAGRPWGPYTEALCEPPQYWDQDLLWRNDGDWAIEDVADELGIAATMRGPGDIQEEPELVIGEECPEEVRGAYPSPIGGNSFTPQWADFDNDGDLDLIQGSIAHPDYLQSDRTLLFVNQGPPDHGFTEESLERGLTWREDEKHPSWVDIDQDGRLDLVITGFRDDAVNYLDVYRQLPDHTFEKLALDVTGIDDHHQESIAWLDIDADGDLDLWIAEDDGEATAWRNEVGDSNHFLVLRLVADAPRDATGARVTVTTADGTQLREVTSGHGHYNPQATRAVHVGLGAAACATVTVTWPDGEVQELGELAADEVLLLEQGGTPTRVGGRE